MQTSGRQEPSISRGPFNEEFVKRIRLRDRYGPHMKYVGKEIALHHHHAQFGDGDV